MANELENLQQQIADAKKELGDLDSLRIERDHIIAQSAAEQKKLDGVSAQVKAEEEKLAQAKIARAGHDAQKNEELLNKEMDLNKRAGDLDLREKRLENGKKVFATDRSAHLESAGILTAAIKAHGDNASALAGRSADLDLREKGLNERENALKTTEKAQSDRKQVLDAREGELKAREDGVGTKTASLDQRESDISVRDKNVALLEKTNEDAREQIVADQLSAKQAADANERERTRLLGVGADMVNEKSGLDTRTAQVESRESAANSKEIELRAREKRVSQKEKDMALEKEING